MAFWISWWCLSFHLFRIADGITDACWSTSLETRWNSLSKLRISSNAHIWYCSSALAPWASIRFSSSSYSAGIGVDRMFSIAAILLISSSSYSAVWVDRMFSIVAILPTSLFCVQIDQPTIPKSRRRTEKSSHERRTTSGDGSGIVLHQSFHKWLAAYFKITSTLSSG